jgi:hypothetical protein
MPHARSPRAATRRAALPADAPWVTVVARAALIVYVGLIALCVVMPSHAGRVFWTVAVASLPLGIVLAGYHRWRRICPLAAIAQWPARVGRGGRHRAGPWLQAHAYQVVFGIFVACLWLRLVATNGDGFALAVFLLTLTGAALVTGAVYTGKTWCNYICPVSFVEKLYTEPRGLRETPNSQCGACTACRPACPDINEENSYWKVILLPQKRGVYYAFPGVVLAFYGYYYLQSGTWNYYFGGGWTQQPGLVTTAFLPGRDAATAGFYYWPAVPRALAAALTLAAGALAAGAAFRAIEPIVARVLARGEDNPDAAAVRSATFSLAAFVAFVSFYSFAGAPTLGLVPGLPHAFQLVVVTAATLALVRRVARRQSSFAEETLARKIIASWRWTDVEPPRDLREAFLIHTIRSRSHEDARRQLLDLYKTAVRDSLESGIISRGEVHRLNALRQQLQVADADHERVMAELADEGGGLRATEARLASPEKQLQLDTYAEALAIHLERQHAAGPADDRLVRALRERYGVTGDEHAAVVERLLHREDALAGHLEGVPAAMEWLAATIVALEARPSAAGRFLVRLLGRRWRRAAEGLVRTLAGDGPALDALRDALVTDAPDAREEALAVVGSIVSPAVAARLRQRVVEARRELGPSPGTERLLRAQLASPEPYVRATTLYLLHSADLASPADLDALAADEHSVVRETAVACRQDAADAVPTSSTLEKMIGLCAIGIFDDLEPEDLAQLARAGTEAWFRAGETLCREGEPGDEVFVVLDGEVSVGHEGLGTTSVEGPGSCIGELAVLDPAPREATVAAATVAVRALRLTGGAFRQALSASPVVSEAVIRILARRLRRALPRAAARRHAAPDGTVLTGYGADGCGGSGE